MAAENTAYAQWSNAMLLNDPSEAGSDCKTTRIAASKYGGFHAVYSGPAQRFRYRRYNGTLLPVVTVFTGMNFNGWVTEALNGDVHVAFENWAGGAPEVGWARSTNGGASFTPVTNISTSGGCAKHPHIVPFGTGNSSDVLMSYYRSGTTGGCNKTLYYARFNGTSWSADSYMGSVSQSEYDCFGMARSPLDGSVYRSFDSGPTTMKMRRYTGSWSAEIPLLEGSWAVRQHMAINASGQVMLLWDSNEHIWSMLYTPGVGPSAPVDLGQGGYSGSCDVCAIPGTNKFYMVLGKTMNHVIGRRWINGTWLNEEHISVGLPFEFTVFPVVTADTTGAIYCAWEFWGSGKAQQYFSTLSVPQIVVTPLSISRSVVIGLSPPNDTFLITNGGPGTLNYSISDNAAWLSTSPSSGSANFTQDNIVTVIYDTGGLAVGTHNASITITAAGAGNSPRTIPVTVTVRPVPEDFDGDSDVDLTDFSLFQLCFNGPNRAHALPGQCSGPDVDDDGDVDLSDFGLFQACFNGPNRPPSSTCPG